MAKAQVLNKGSKIAVLGLAAMFNIGFTSKTLFAALNSGASFLKIDPGARPSAMAGAYTAITGDLSSIFFNPAGLSGFRQQEFGGTHAQYLLGSQYDFISFAQPTTIGAFGLSATRLAAPVSDGRDANRQSTGGFSDVDTAYTLGFSRPFSAATSLGLNIKYIQSQLASYKADSFAFDIGAIHKVDRLPMTIGASIMNVGRPMQYLSQADPLPLTVAVGSTYRIANTLQIAMDISREVHDQITDIRVGCEYALMPSFSMRLGYAPQTNSMTGGPLSGGMLSGIGTGFGLRLGRYNLDYGFTPFGNALGDIQRISMAVKLGSDTSDRTESGYTQYYFPDKQDESSRVLLLNQ